MAKYLIEASYTVDGVKGLFKEGGTGRRTAIENAVRGLGGTVESFHFVFGDDDVIVILDMPDNVSVAALSLGVSAAGGATSSVRVLLTPEEIDAAVKKTLEYRAPGG
ncbi:MAG: GYD domain-containing protein [Candidatus Dormibacteria bacterium]